MQHQDKKARFRVVTMRDAGLPQKIQVEVRLVADRNVPGRHWFQLRLPDVVLRLSPIASGGLSAIGFHSPWKFATTGAGPLCRPALPTLAVAAAMSSLSFPYPWAPPLTITFWIESDKISTPASVRTSDPGVGMGIEFTGLSPENQERVQQAVEKAFEANKAF